MTTKAKKTLYFVRHAESEQNVATRDLHAGRQGAARRIIDLGWDAPLSETGRIQLEHAKTSAEFKAWKDDAKVELIAHSPYVRAVGTARACFEGREISELECLHERTLSEYFIPWLLDRRIGALRDWLDARPEQRIALVGHGQFFKRCLGAPEVLRNVGVVEVAYENRVFTAKPKTVWPGFAPGRATPLPGEAAPVAPETIDLSDRDDAS